MDHLTCARHRVAVATDLPAVLDAAYDAFEDMIAVLRRHQEDNEDTFPAFVMAAAAAANGRDCIAGADALPQAVPRDPISDLSADTSAADVARAIAALSSELADRLTAVAASTPRAGDRRSCESAAAEAAAIARLLGGASSP